ncbi:MAG TPA: GNAT family N-acetyltransferase [Eubacteriaceae bacterium]|nr:GNAT family N-acetyltransferase [Eubacteriaceae bacterium]
MEELEKAFDIRKTVFVAEQQVPLEYEFDEFDRLDGRCRHVIAYDKKKAVGTGRVRKTGKEAKIERICILPSYRRRGIGQRIVTQLETLIKQDEVQACQLHAQKYAEEFYRNLGYETVSEPFMEDGIEHVKMVKSIKTK